MHPGEDAVDRLDPAEAGEGALQARVGEPAAAEGAVNRDRVADAEAAAQPLAIVVGDLVGHREGPHLHREQRHVALLRAGGQNRERQRPAGAGGDSDWGGDAVASAQQRHRERGANRGGRPGPYRHAQRRRWPRPGPHKVGEYR